MTNPGHIDPGFEGALHFTLINMGREDFSFRAGDTIVTVLLFELDAAVASDYSKRHPKPGDNADSVQLILNRLSADFADLERRAESIAAKQVQKEAWRVAYGPAIVAGIVAFITGYYTMIGSMNNLNNDMKVLKGKPDADFLKSEITSLQNKMDPTELRNQLNGLKADLAELRREVYVRDAGSATNGVVNAGKH